MSEENVSWLDRATTWATSRRDSEGSRGSGHRGSGTRVTMNVPTVKRPRADREQSSRSISEAMRLLRSSEEQEMLLGEEEMADDDGCFPPRKNDDPQAPNPHVGLPVYTTIHRIRRLIIASIGLLRISCLTLMHVANL